MIKNTLSNKIEKMQSRDDKKIRDYIGASIIGSDCPRQIWYEFKGYQAEEVPTKIRRTWEIGKKIEELILNWLTLSGISIIRDWDELIAEGMPFFKGNLDAVWMKKDKPFAIIEVKTAKDSSFNVFIKKGVKMWNPQYYAQIQAYMGMSGIFSAYILVLNKDNSDISDELVSYDKDFYETLREKALMIYNANVEPARINGSPLWYKCKMCKFNKICHK